jgi:hypothetical protein
VAAAKKQEEERTVGEELGFPLESGGAEDPQQVRRERG